MRGKAVLKQDEPTVPRGTNRGSVDRGFLKGKKVPDKVAQNEPMRKPRVAWRNVTIENRIVDRTLPVRLGGISRKKVVASGATQGKPHEVAVRCPDRREASETAEEVNDH